MDESRSNASRQKRARQDSVLVPAKSDRLIQSKRHRDLGYGTHDAPIDLLDSDSDPDVMDWIPATPASLNSPETYMPVEQQETWTAEKCLKRVLEVFPDVSHRFVMEKWESSRWTNDGIDKYQTLVEFIMEHASYPKEKDQRKKLRRNDENALDYTISIYSAAELEALTRNPQYASLGQKLLSREFPLVPVIHINATLARLRNVYDTYQELCRTSDLDFLPYQNLKHARRFPRHITSLDPLAQAVHGELERGRRKMEALIQGTSDEASKAQLEAFNERNARETNQMAECGCCFADVPINRTAHCDGNDPHLFCFTCISKHVETEIGSRKCRPQCLDMSECDAGFAEHQLRLAISKKTTLHQLLRLQQQEDLKAANIPGLTECPFCDYMAVCPDAHIDREFFCGNPECGRTSCRFCNEETHTPLSCDAAAKQRDQDHKIEARHFVEEAMTDALVRVCNKCRNRFVKEEGCNKMTCPTCHNTQCYVCSVNTKGYEHFSRAPGDGKCPTHDTEGVEVRHEQEVTKAEEEASAKIRAAKPDISADDLTIKVSDSVKAEEEAKRSRLPMDMPAAAYAAILQERGAQRLAPLQFGNIGDPEALLAGVPAPFGYNLQRHLYDGPPLLPPLGIGLGLPLQPEHGGLLHGPNKGRVLGQNRDNWQRQMQAQHAAQANAAKQNAGEATLAWAQRNEYLQALQQQRQLQMQQRQKQNMQQAAAIEAQQDRVRRQFLLVRNMVNPAIDRLEQRAADEAMIRPHGAIETDSIKCLNERNSRLGKFGMRQQLLAQQRMPLINQEVLQAAQQAQQLRRLMPANNPVAFDQFNRYFEAQQPQSGAWRPPIIQFDGAMDDPQFPDIIQPVRQAQRVMRRRVNARLLVQDLGGSQ